MKNDGMHSRACENRPMLPHMARGVRPGFAILLAGILGLGGCATSSNSVATGASGTSAAAFQSVSATNEASAEDYRVGAEDELDITVFRVPELSKTVRVSATGAITLPLIGATQVAGKTTSEIEAELTRRLAADYLQSPQVDVQVKEAVSQRITVEGEVDKPGIYPTTGRTTLLQAIVEAGGLSDLADPRGVVVFRTIDGKRHAAVFDYKSIRSGRAEDPVILGGDIIAVDTSGVKTALQALRGSTGVLGLFVPML